METLHVLMKEFVGSPTDEDDGQRLAKLCDTVREMGGTGCLLEVIEDLDPLLTDVEIVKRKRGTWLLANLMHILPVGSLDDAEVSTLVAFLVSRLAEHHSIQPLLVYALLALVSYQPITSQHAIQISRKLFAEMHVQSMMQPDRKNTYNLFGNLLENHTRAVQSISGDFVLGFIQAMDGEKDPRNLIVCFRNAALLINQLNIGVLAEDLFEVLSCYFPIDFHAPSSEEDLVDAKEDLVTSLRECLSATDKFSEFLLPLIVEKLSSDVTSAQLEAARLFATCAPRYSHEHVRTFVHQLWEAVRRDLLFKREGDELLAGLRGVVHTLTLLLSASDDSESCDALRQLQWLIVKDTTQALRIRDENTLAACVPVIQAACVSNATFTDFVKQLVPEAAGTLKTLADMKMYELVVTFWASLFDSGFQLENTTDECKDLCTSFFDVMFAACIQAKQNLDYEFLQCPSTAKLIASLAKHPEVCAQCENFTSLSNQSIDCLLFSLVPPASETLAFIRTLIDHHPTFARTAIYERAREELHAASAISDVLFEICCTFVQLLSASKEFADGAYSITSELLRLVGEKERVSLRKKILILRTTSIVCAQPALECTHLHAMTYTVAHALLRLAPGLDAMDGVDTSEVSEHARELFVCTLSLLRRTFRERVDLMKLIVNLVLRSGELLRRVSPQGGGCDLCECINKEWLALDGGGEIWGLCENATDLEKINLSSHETDDAKLLSTSDSTNGGAVVGMVTDDDKLNSLDVIGDSAGNNSVSSTQCGKGLSLFFKAVVFNLLPSDISMLDICSMKSHICTIVKENQIVDNNIAETFALLINKCDEDSCQQIMDDLMNVMKASGFVNIKFLALICKALLLRCHGSSREVVDAMISSLKERDSSVLVDECFSLIISSDDVFTKENSAIIRLLHKQYTIRLLLPRLMTMVELDGGKLSIPGICCLLRGVPQQLISNDMQALVPLLVSALSFSDAGVVLSGLETLRVVVQGSAQDSVVSHLHSMLSQLISLLTSSSASAPTDSVKMRITALSCLDQLAHYPTYLIYPSKKRVLQVVQTCLDDRKRVVRNAAIACSNTWHLLMTGGT